MASPDGAGTGGLRRSRFTGNSVPDCDRRRADRAGDPGLVGAWFCQGASAMPLRNIAIFGVVAVLIIAYVAWTRNMQKPAVDRTQTEAPTTGSSSGTPPSGDATGGAPPSGVAEAPPPVVQSGSDPGLVWKVPEGWTD